MRYLLLLFVSLCLLACSADKGNSTSNETQSVRSIKDFRYHGPDTLCTDIKEVIANPPDDITQKQKLIAKLSLDACALPNDDITVEDVVKALGGKKIAYNVTGNILTIYASHSEDKAITCCSIQPQLTLIGKHENAFIFAKKFQLKNLESARLEFYSPDFMTNTSKEAISYRGPKSFPDRTFIKDELAGTVTTHNFESEALGEKRAYLVYIPPHFKPSKDTGVVVLGDGSSLGFHAREWEPLIESGKMSNFIAIGVVSGQRGIVDSDKTYDFDIRNADYINNYTHGPKRFDKHLSFVVDELLPSVASEYEIKLQPENTVLIGGSSGGSFALWGVLKRPDIFGISVGTSPSGPIPEEISDQAAKRRYYISAGIYEPGFRANAILYDEVLSAYGAKTDLKTYADGHSIDHRAQRMLDVLQLLFPAEK